MDSRLRVRGWRPPSRKPNPFSCASTSAQEMPVHVGNLRSFLVRLPSLFIGLFLFAAGAVTNLYSGLGMSPWGVFHVGLSGISGLTLGQVSQLVGLAVLL